MCVSSLSAQVIVADASVTADATTDVATGFVQVISSPTGSTIILSIIAPCWFPPLPSFFQTNTSFLNSFGLFSNVTLIFCVPSTNLKI